jgi:hypothetical protein
MPCFTMVPPRGDHPIHGHFWVPIDDENNWAWSFDYHPTRPLSAREVQAMRDGQGIHVRYVPGHLPAAAEQGQQLPDGPCAQKAGISYSGFEGIDAGRVACRRAWADPGPHPREPGARPTTASSWRRQRL